MADDDVPLGAFGFDDDGPDDATAPGEREPDVSCETSQGEIEPPHVVVISPEQAADIERIARGPKRNRAAYMRAYRAAKKKENANGPAQ